MVENSIHDVSGEKSGLTQNIAKIKAIIANRGPKYFAGLAYYRFAKATHKLRVQKLRQAKTTEQPDSVTVQGRPFHLHHSLEGLSEALILYGYHEPTASKLYSSSLRAGEQVLDVGGNIGYYPLLASKAVGASGRVVAIEPVPGTFDVLRQNVAGLGNVEIKQVAAGGKNGTQTLYISEVPNWSGFHTHSTQRVAEAVEVQTQTLDSLVSEFNLKPDLIRMDIEGGETQVLPGASATLSKYKPRIFAEFHPSLVGWDAVKATLMMLQKHGYQFGTMLDRLFDDAWVSPWVGNKMLTRVRLDHMLATPVAQLPSIFHLALDRPHA